MRSAVLCSCSALPPSHPMKDPGPVHWAGHEALAGEIVAESQAVAQVIFARWPVEVTNYKLDSHPGPAFPD